MEKYIMAFDAGTTSNRCIIFDKKRQYKERCSKGDLGSITQSRGWVEQDAGEIWATQLGVAGEAVARIGVSAADIAAIGITNQRETTIVWNRRTGEPIYNAIVWQCRRTSNYCVSLKEAGYDKMINEKTGLVTDAYFSATKLKWILDNVPGAKESAQRGELCFGTVDTWLIWKLTGGKVHVTDYSNASRTMMFNIHTLEWDDDILKLFDIPRSMLPEPKSSSEVYRISSTKSSWAEEYLFPVRRAISSRLYSAMLFYAGRG